ncbi:MAG: hypothetical protein JNJ83_13370 [Verrucomicrobiaceae bacterium]|nr:hypothetical protein [Verrucomicrobiaceae bacterium]
MNNKLLHVAFGIILVLLFVTNPSVDQYRGYIKERQGLAGSLGLLAVDVLSTSDAKGKGIHRDNYWLFSKFYLGGDGLLPRQDLAWGAVGRFWEIKSASR